MAPYREFAAAQPTIRRYTASGQGGIVALFTGTARHPLTLVFLVSCLLYTIAPVSIVRHIAFRQAVDGETMLGAICAYLLIGMAFAFIPMTIGALAGVRHADAGIASGLINTTQQIGGAIGVAAATTIAATYTSRYVGAHPGATASSGVALTHGFHMAFYALAATTALAAVVCALVVESRQRLDDEGALAPEAQPVLEAAA